MDFENLQEKIDRFKKDYNLKQEEIHKYLTMFQEIVDQINNKQETGDSEEGIKDMIKTVDGEIANFLNQDINSSDFPEIIKKALKTPRAIVNFIRTIKEYGEK